MQLWYLVYHRSTENRWWNRYLDPALQHVQLWRPVSYGPRISDTLWLLFDPGMECVVVDAVFRPDPPWSGNSALTVQRVLAVCTEKRVRNWFSFGPITCVEIAKACLGLNSMWLRTPRQLHTYVAKHRGVLISR